MHDFLRNDQNLINGSGRTPPEFFLLWARFCLTNLSVTFGGARSRFRDSFLIHVAHRCREECAHVCVHAVKTRTFNDISIFFDREQGQKGLVLPRSSFSTSRRATRSPSSFCLRRFSFRVAHFVVRPLCARYANLRFEKLIARPSTCPCCVPPPVPLPDLLKSPRRPIVGCYDAQCTYAPLL